MEQPLRNKDWRILQGVLSSKFKDREMEKQKGEKLRRAKKHFKLSMQRALQNDIN